MEALPQSLPLQAEILKTQIQYFKSITDLCSLAWCQCADRAMVLDISFYKSGSLEKLLGGFPLSSPMATDSLLEFFTRLSAHATGRGIALQRQLDDINRQLVALGEGCPPG
jgi:hypothetical protein